MRLPIRPVRGRWPGWLENLAPLRRFFRLDPLTILDPDAAPSAFREAMSSIYVGGTIKITGADRHSATDDLLVNTIDTRDARIVDVGASDGSTSLDLITKLDGVGGFAEFTIADLYLTLSAVDVWNHTLLFHGNDCVLVGGRRLMAWPQLARTVALICRPLISKGRSGLDSGREVLLLNPRTRDVVANDSRVNYRVHDVFNVWSDPKPTVIKIANLLRRLYFTDDQLLQALCAVRDSLVDGGHLLIVDNPRIPNASPRAGLWRREDSRFIEIARIGEPEIADLVQRVG